MNASRICLRAVSTKSVEIRPALTTVTFDVGKDFGSTFDSAHVKTKMNASKERTTASLRRKLVSTFQAAINVTRFRVLKIIVRLDMNQIRILLFSVKVKLWLINFLQLIKINQCRRRWVQGNVSTHVRSVRNLHQWNWRISLWASYWRRLNFDRSRFRQHNSRQHWKIRIHWSNSAEDIHSRIGKKWRIVMQTWFSNGTRKIQRANSVWR